MGARASAPSDTGAALSNRSLWLATAMIVLTPLFWAGHTVVGRLVANDIPTFSLVSLRWWFCATVLLAFTYRQVMASRHALLRHWRYMLLNTLVGPVLFPIFLYSGLKTTTVTNTSIIQSLVPCMVLILAWVILRERFKALQAVGLVVSMLGVATIIAKGNPLDLFAITLVPGDLIILAGFFSWALYTVVIRLRPPELKSEVVLSVAMAIAAVVTTPLWIGEAAAGDTIPMTSEAWTAIVYIVVFPSLLGYFFYNTAINLVGPTKAGIASHLAPPLGVLLGVIFLNEAFGLYHAVSFALVLCGVALVIRGGRVSKSPAPA